ncbi:DUF2790 domain-containing protein [Pseudomonas sp. Z8(2022)]|jgi:hypothetical protein|uniref:DUF2790 domain-containing protein n=1 Tax=Pseudomonas sp. Z8(2022) TaxID=2962597 RepID=UPI0021F42798|nr:DUF2790 domain-containing protein [Pseudomonas sp. Z8(2022)]UYP31765.1 DUF2790 domain-containing protein [Pseudomonas sp. Z8(2022)]
MKNFLFATAMLLAAGSAFAGTPSHAPVIHDKDGFFVHLDVDKVLSTSDVSSSCGVVPAQLRYLDHQGREHVLDYQVLGGGCSDH